jgi:anti-anti-sigma factor
VLKMPRQMDAVSSPPVVEQGEDRLTGHARLVLDFTDTAYISSAGLAAVARLAREAKARSRELRLAGCAGDVLRTLQLVRFDKMIPIDASVASATRR